jgi:hypothetical protein
MSGPSITYIDAQRSDLFRNRLLAVPDGGPILSTRLDRDWLVSGYRSGRA